MDAAAQALVELGRRVRTRIRAGMAGQQPRLAQPAAAGVGDLQYGLDMLAEEDLLSAVRELFAGEGPLRLLSEGLSASGETVFPGAAGRVLVVDPIDGTRGLMHDKRSAFFLAALAPDGPAPRLRDVTHACLLELPCTRSELSDVLVVSPEGGLEAWTEDVSGGPTRPLAAQPSQATDLDHGFATVVRFFGGAGRELGELQDRLFEALMPGRPEDWMGVFEDQYICNGGQMHALITGRDRFIADLRPLFRHGMGGRLLCSHPYDVLATPIAEAAGVVVTDATGQPLDVPLDLHTDVAWVGYASEALRSRIEPALLDSLKERPGGSSDHGHPTV